MEETQMRLVEQLSCQSKESKGQICCLLIIQKTLVIRNS